ncbi:MAG: WcaF family extracellular polysaccharide biosynthesis acetyltransferase [Paludibacteraceae bacterium]|nr:WcaF family extracellular polysaccharide biosynthesis acetyltransferase [Paludibacteraceae bacterium]
MSRKVDLSQYNKAGYRPRRNAFVRGLWYVTNMLFFKTAWCPCYGWKRALLRMYGAKVGARVVIKPGVNIKYPWRLTIGDNSWIGENVWIDNLADVRIGQNCCISQGAMLLCGNHDYTKAGFDLLTGEIVLKDGAWVGAKAVVCPGVTMGAGSVLTVGSVATKDLAADGIYQGNPAVLKKKIQ